MADFVDRFDQLYLPKLGVRAPTFRAVVREAVTRGVKSIVETGCVRKVDNWEGDGQSTVIWGDYIRYHNGSFVTIDNDQEAIDVAKALCPGTVTICDDSVAALNKRDLSIDLLYLDSFDMDNANPGPAAMHALFELCAARPLLHSGSIVFIDDSPYSNGCLNGKAGYVNQYFHHLGLHPFTTGYQIAWIMP